MLNGQELKAKGRGRIGESDLSKKGGREGGRVGVGGILLEEGSEASEPAAKSVL